MLEVSKRGKNFFSDFFDDLITTDNNLMKTDIKEVDGRYEFLIDLPGYKKEDIKISIKNNYLTVEAVKEEILDEEKKDFIKKERHYGSISRSFYVGDVTMKDLKASYKDGTLKIDCKKVTEEKTKYLDIEW